VKAIALGVIVLAGFAGYAAAAPESSTAKPYGIWKVSLNPVDPDVPGGVWTLTLRPRRYSLLNSRNPISNGGRLKVEGDVLTFSRETLCSSAVGRYRWRIAGGTLRLKLLGKDSCSGNDRTVVLTSKPWRKHR
jgi:hypothetical protein